MVFNYTTITCYLPTDTVKLLIYKYSIHIKEDTKYIQFDDYYHYCGGNSNPNTNHPQNINSKLKQKHTKKNNSIFDSHNIIKLINFISFYSKHTLYQTQADTTRLLFHHRTHNISYVPYLI